MAGFFPPMGVLIGSDVAQSLVTLVYGGSHGAGLMVVGLTFHPVPARTTDLISRRMMRSSLAVLPVETGWVAGQTPPVLSLSRRFCSLLLDGITVHTYTHTHTHGMRYKDAQNNVASTSRVGLC